MLCSFKQVLALSELHCSMNERSGIKCLDQRLLKNMKIANRKKPHWTQHKERETQRYILGGCDLPEKALC
jgi:hypothetical protein